MPTPIENARTFLQQLDERGRVEPLRFLDSILSEQGETGAAQCIEAVADLTQGQDLASLIKIAEAIAKWDKGQAFTAFVVLKILRNGFEEMRQIAETDGHKDENLRHRYASISLKALTDWESSNPPEPDAQSQVLTYLEGIERESTLCTSPEIEPQLAKSYLLSALRQYNSAGTVDPALLEKGRTHAQRLAKQSRTMDQLHDANLWLVGFHVLEGNIDDAHKLVKDFLRHHTGGIERFREAERYFANHPDARQPKADRNWLALALIISDPENEALDHRPALAEVGDLGFAHGLRRGDLGAPILRFIHQLGPIAKQGGVILREKGVDVRQCRSFTWQPGFAPSEAQLNRIITPLFETGTPSDGRIILDILGRFEEEKGLLSQASQLNFAAALGRTEGPAAAEFYLKSRVAPEGSLFRYSSAHIIYAKALAAQERPGEACEHLQKALEALGEGKADRKGKRKKGGGLRFALNEIRAQMREPPLAPVRGEAGLPTGQNGSKNGEEEPSP